MKQKINLRHLALGLLVALSMMLTLGSCGSTASISGGLSDEAYVILSANRTYINETVYVQIDAEESIPVKVVRDDEAARTGRRIVLKPGKHRIVVFDSAGKVLYNQHIFVSTRNAKTIVLP